MCCGYGDRSDGDGGESTDVTIIEIEIEIAILTENRIELKSNFSCIPSNDFSIEALDRL